MCDPEATAAMERGDDSSDDDSRRPSRAEKIAVVADDRERPSGIPDLLAARPEVEPTIERMDAGDYAVQGAVLIERKAAADFAHSLTDGRLFAQASRLASGRIRPAYIIVGDSQAWASARVPRHALQGALITLMLVFDIPVFRALDAEEAANLILYVGRQMARLRNPGRVLFHQSKAKRRRTRQLRLLQNLPGVGPRRAQELLDHFGSVRACLGATAEDLAEIRGIGRSTARRIVETVNEARPTYGSRDDLLLF